MTKVTLNESEFRALKEIIADRLQTLQNNLKKLKKKLNKHSSNLDEYEAYIKNYITYDIHNRLQEAK